MDERIALTPDDFRHQQIIAEALGKDLDREALGQGLKAVNHLLRCGYVIVSADAVAPLSWEYESGARHAARNRERARQALAEALRCRCETLHGHCYVSGCLCPRHANEVGVV
jgi:hypothetical protein